MATNSRDAKLTLSVEALGSENISKLETELRDLAATGGSSAAEFGQLADEIGRLGAQNAALQSIKTLTADTDALRDKQEQVSVSIQEVTQRLQGLRQATVDAKTAQDTARQALTEGEQAYIASGNALRTLKTEYDNAGKQTTEYRSRLQALVAEQNDARLALVGLREENRTTNATLGQAETAQRKVETTLARTTVQYDAATKALSKQAAELKEAAAAADTLGVNTDELAAAETALLSTFTKATSTVQARKAAVVEMAEADRLAAIEAKGLAALYAKGEAALQAETLAQRDAARAVRDYVAAKAQVAADSAAWQKEADEIVSLHRAQQQATASTQTMVEKLQALAAVNAFEKQAAEAQKMVQAASYVRFWEQALDAADAKQKELVASTKRVNDAISLINVRPIEAVRLEIANTNAAMATLAASGKFTGAALTTAMQQGKAKVAELELEVRQLTDTLTLGDKAAGLFKNSMGQIAAGNVVADAVGYLINKVKELGVAFVTTIAAQESMRRGLNAVYKDATTTAAQMEFLRKTAILSGVAVGDLGPSFLKFAAATRAANIPLEVTNALFAATTRAAGTLGLSGEQVSGMLEALGQMASKGTVSMEELRQQLGDRLPGALSLVAQGLGITEGQLIKLVESGQLAARDMFPALTKSLGTMQGEVTGLTATWQNLKNVLTGVAQDAGDAGWAAILSGALTLLGAVVGSVAMGLSTVWEGMRLVGVAAVALAGTLRGEGATAWAHFNEQVDVSIERLARQGDRLSAMLDPAGQAAGRMRDLAAAQSAASAATAKTTTDIAEQPKALATVAASIAYVAEVTKILANNQMDLGAKIVNINVKSAERLALLEKESVAADKMVKAVEVEGSAIVTLTKLRGSAIETLKAEQTAAENNLKAAQSAAVAQRAITEVLEQQRQALVLLAKQEATGLEGRKAEIEALDKKLVKSRAETAQTDAAVSAVTQEVAARKLATATLVDNSARLDEFRKASVAAEAAVIAYARALEQGRGTQGELTKLQEQAALAMGLYRDAVKDAAEKTQALNLVEQAKINLQTAGLSVQQQAYMQLAAAAKATNNLVLATSYEIDAKKIQIQITELSAEAKRKDAAASIASAEAEKALLIANGTLTEAKKLEIEARILNAKAKASEADAAAIAVKGLNAEITALRLGTTTRDQQTTAMGRNNTERERSISLQEKELDLLEREDAVRRRKLNIDKDGYSLGADGQRLNAAVPTDSYIMDAGKSAGLTDKQVAQLMQQFFQNGSPTGFNRQGGNTSKDWFTIVNEAITKMRVDTFKESANKPAATTSAASDTPASGTTKTVTINIGGKSRNVNTASASDAAALVAILRELENQGGTST